MQDPKTATARKTLAVALLSVVGGLIGMWAGRGVAVSRCRGVNADYVGLAWACDAGWINRAAADRLAAASRRLPEPAQG